MSDQRFRVSRKSPVNAKLAELASHRARAALANELLILGHAAKYCEGRSDTGDERVLRSLHELHAKVDTLLKRLAGVDPGRIGQPTASHPGGPQVLEDSDIDHLLGEVAGFNDA